MSKRSSSSKENDSTTSKRPFAPAQSTNDCHTDDEKPGILELDEDQEILIKNVDRILKYQKKAVPYLYPSNKKNVRSKTITSLILQGLKCLDEKLKDAKTVKVSIAAFGAQGKGKSFVLNHVLKYNQKNGNENVNILPSGRGGSKTPVPIKIKYGPNIKLIATKSDKSKDCLCNVTTLAEVALSIEKLCNRSEANKDLVCIELVAPLPVFADFQEKTKCTYQDVDVEIEFVDLPGRGDDHGNALIGKELDVADVILVFKNAASGRLVSVEDLKEVFQRRMIFDYENRPKFVTIENFDKDNPGTELDEDSAQKKNQEETAKFSNEWRKLIEWQQEEESRESFNIVYKRLPLTTAKEFLEKLQEESKAIIFSTKRDGFLADLWEAVIAHVNGVILNKNIHPVMQTIHKGANTRKKRINALISKEKKTTQRSKDFKPIKRLDFQLTLQTREKEELFNSFKSNILNLDLSETPDFMKVHEELMDFFKEELVMQQLLYKLRYSLEEYCETLLQVTERVNGVFVSDEGLNYHASLLCEKKVSEFMNQNSRDFIDTCLKKLSLKRPSRKVNRQWAELENDQEERKTLLQDHLDELVEHLSELLSKGSRDNGLVQLLDKLCDSINDLIRLGWKMDHSSIINDRITLGNIKRSNQNICGYTLKKIREVNPHIVPKKAFLDSKVDFPEPMLTFDVHNTNMLPPVNHTSRIKKVLNALEIKKSGGSVLEELRRKLGLTVGSLTAHEGCSELKWTAILLYVLQDDNDFHHMTLDNPLSKSCKPDPKQIPNDYLKKAKQQLFAFQKSNAKCIIIEKDSIPDDTIKITINENKDGLIASVSHFHYNDLRKLVNPPDLTKQLTPIFIPSTHYGPNKDSLGNLYLEEDPWETKEKDSEDYKEAEQSCETNELTGLENMQATIFCVVEPVDEQNFKETLSKKKPSCSISFRYVVLPQNGRGIGVSRSIIKLLAESLKLQQYWTIDDDIKLVNEYNKDSGYWKRCTMGRALLFGQRVFLDCMNKIVNDITEGQRYSHGPNLQTIFPEWATKGRNVAGRLMFNEATYVEVRNNISSVDGHFTNEDMHEDCKGDGEKEKEWCSSKEKCIEKIKDLLLSENYKRIGRISIGHEISGRQYGYHARCDNHYRKSMQNYQMVLHNMEAIKGFNYVTDDVVLRHEGGTVDQPELRDDRHLGLKWEDKSFCKALEFYGIVGYQLITVALRNEKLKNVFGRIGNSYLPEQLTDGDSDLNNNN